MPKPYVLIIEDDPKLVDIYEMLLLQAGFDTIIDVSGNEYAAKLTNALPGLIILDLHMPFASGPEILRQIRMDERLATVPVIVITADIILAKAVQEQADTVLTKPVSITRLRETALRLCPTN